MSNQEPSKPYLGLEEHPVKNIMNLFQTGLREMVSARGLLNTGRRLLGIPESGAKVYIIGEKSEILKIEFTEKSVSLLVLYYIPKTHRLDIYDSEGLVAVSERKKFLYMRCTEGLKRLGFEGIFKGLISLT